MLHILDEYMAFCGIIILSKKKNHRVPPMAYIYLFMKNSMNQLTKKNNSNHKKLDYRIDTNSIALESSSVNTFQKKYLTEFEKSCINHSLIELNFKALDGEIAYRYLLEESIYSLGSGKKVPASFQYTTGEVTSIKKRYKHIEYGGWWGSGLDPLNNWQKMNWGCFKPDQPRSIDGRCIKYEHPPKTGTRAFFLDMPQALWSKVAEIFSKKIKPTDSQFWKWVLDNRLPIIITEGIKKAASLMSAGYPAIGLPGINSGYRKVSELKRELIPDLKVLFGKRKIYFCFDNDSKESTKKNVQIATHQTARLLRSGGCSTFLMSWSGPTKGIDDLIFNEGIDKLESVFDSATNLNIKSPKNPKIKELYPLPLPDLLIEAKELDRNILIGIEKKIIGVKSGKGTGKTKSLCPYVQHIKSKVRYP